MACPGKSCVFAISNRSVNSKERSRMSRRSLSCFRVLAAALLMGLCHGSLQAQSLWKEDSSRSMVSDKRANGVGDILTILVQENNSASKDNSTQTSKKSSIDAAIEAFLYSPNASSLLT